MYVRLGLRQCANASMGAKNDGDDKAVMLAVNCLISRLCFEQILRHEISLDERLIVESALFVYYLTVVGGSPSAMVSE